MKYTIKEIEIKRTGTTNGKDWKITEMMLIDEQGAEHSNISTFDTVEVGAALEGEITVNDKGYKNFKTAKATAGANFKTAQIEKTMERKEQSIGKFQDNKDWSIMISSTMRDAVILATAEYSNPKVLDTLEEGITKWRNWLIANWEVNKTDKPPF